MNPTDASYFAGLIDGEGAIMLIRSHVERKHPSHVVTVAITSIDREILEWCKSVAGGTIVKKWKSPKNPQWSDSWEWRVRHQDAIDLLRQVYPHLKIRRKQRKTKFLLSNMEVVARGKLSEEELEKRSKMYEEFRLL